jgi:predicted ester cyclase
VQGEGVTPLKRYYGDDFIVDETMWHGQIKDGAVFLCNGKSGKVSFRLLHIFEFQQGKIAREQAWCDLAAIQRQLNVTLS